MTAEGFSVINVGLLICNIFIFGLNLKLYTEYFKAEDQRKRK